MTNIRHVLAALAVTASLYGIYSAWCMGNARNLSEYVQTADRIRDYQISSPALLADQAVGLSNKDPEAHYARGLALVREGRVDNAIPEFQQAVALRPRDYKLWIKLGSVLEDEGDLNAAMSAYTETIRRARYYAQPRWRIGNLMLRTGQTPEAFAELRRAAYSDPALVPSLIDLACSVAKNDAHLVEELVQPRNHLWKILLAQQLARLGKSTEAVALFREAGEVSDQERTNLVNQLLSRKSFLEAYEVWSGRSPATPESRNNFSTLSDGGFDEPIKFNDPSFGWQAVTNSEGLQVSLDQINPKSGSKSLRLDFKGASEPTSPIVNQLALIQQKSHYRLSFMARSNELITGGSVLIVITDASSSDNHVLAQTVPLPQGTSNWQGYSVEFDSEQETQAVRINIQRQSCSKSTCPAFGQVWLDDFVLQKR